MAVISIYNTHNIYSQLKRSCDMMSIAQQKTRQANRGASTIPAAFGVASPAVETVHFALGSTRCRSTPG